MKLYIIIIIVEALFSISPRHEKLQRASVLDMIVTHAHSSLLCSRVSPSRLNFFSPLQCLKFHVIIIRYPSGLENPDRVYQLDLCVCVVIFTPLGADGYGKTTIVLDMLLFGGRVPESEAWMCLVLWSVNQCCVLCLFTAR